MKLLKQRRFWASIAAFVALVLPLIGYNNFDSNAFVEVTMGIINGISALAAIILPIWSYLKPKSS